VLAQHTVKLLVALEDAGRTGGVAGLLVRGSLLVHIACKRVNGISYDSSWSDLRRTKVVVKVRRAMARGATRLAAATAERCRNMASNWGRAESVRGGIRRCGAQTCNSDDRMKLYVLASRLVRRARHNLAKCLLSKHHCCSCLNIPAG
jgi:hypothetical protein